MTPVDRVAFQLADPERFRNYLMVKHVDEVIGSSASSQHCPIAEYLRTLEVVGPDCHLAVNSGVFCLGDELPRSVPEWTGRFIKTLDALYLGCQGIRGEEALRVLDRVLEEMAP